MQRIQVLSLFILFSFSTLFNNILWAEKISNEQIYRDLKIFHAKTEEQFKSIDKRLESVDKRFDMVQKQINNMMILIAALMTGMFGFAGYIAYDRRKFQQDILAIHQNFQNHNNQIKEIEKTISNAQQENETIKEALRIKANQDKVLSEALRKVGIL